MAQLAAMVVAGAIIGLVGTTITITAVALSLPFVDHRFLMSAADVGRVIAAAALAGAAGGVFGAGIGSLARNTGGAVTAVFLGLFVAPTLLVQFASGAASWVPNTLVGVLSGVGHEVSLAAAIAALVIWAALPAVLGIVAVEKRDVV
jgi:hypothetical protein